MKRNLLVIGVYLLGMASGVALTFRILDIQEFREKIDQSIKVVFIDLKDVWLKKENISLPCEVPNEDDINQFVPEDGTEECDAAIEEKVKRCDYGGENVLIIPVPTADTNIQSKNSS